jgi:hypothetical protein
MNMGNGGKVLTGKKPKYWEKNRLECHFVHYKYAIMFPRNELGPPW